MCIVVSKMLFCPQGMVTLKELAPTFLQGAHYPTILIILQALLPLIGEVNYSFIYSTANTVFILAICTAVQYSAVQYGMVQYSVVQYSVVWYSTVWYSTV